MTLFALLIAIVNAPTLPEVTVQTPPGEIEGVFVPAGYTGPIVAAPFTESAF